MVSNAALFPLKNNDSSSMGEVVRSNCTSSKYGSRCPFLSTSQYSGLRSSTTILCESNSFSRNGPLPTIVRGLFVTAYASRNRPLATAAPRMCRGKIATLPKYSKNGAKISGVTTFTVRSSTLVTSKFLPSPRNRSYVSRLYLGLYITSFQVNTTSSAVSGWPSLQRKFFRSLKVHVFWSGATDHDSARPGSASCVSMFTVTKELNNSRATASEGLSTASTGLNVLGLPSTDSTSRPPGTPGSHAATFGGSGRGCPPDFAPQPAPMVAATSNPAAKE